MGPACHHRINKQPLAHPMKKRLLSTLVTLLPLISAQAFTNVIDGQGIPSEGLPLLATQTSATGFGDSSGTQNSNGGSELNQIFGEISGGNLNLGITGNLEANFNKMFLFFDAVPGGEATLQGDNNDGGFGEINNLAGATFDGASGDFTADYGMRFEVGGGFLGIRSFNLIENTGGDLLTAGGPGDLPFTGTANGVTLGWDNSNALGVTGESGDSAATATTGWEFQIDMETFFGGMPVQDVGIVAIVTSADASFASNMVLPGIPGGGANLGSAPFDLGYVTVAIPEPSVFAGLLGAVAMLGVILRRTR